MIRRGFWQLPAWSKLDKLDEIRHGDIIISVLNDAETGIEVYNDDSVLVYGEQDGLLIERPSLPLLILLCIYAAFIRILYPSPSSNTR